jgi:hypothetical protein
MAQESHRRWPEGVRLTLEGLDGRALIVIDELDRLEDNESLMLLADTIKTLSDHAVGTTLRDYEFTERWSLDDKRPTRAGAR